VPVEFSRKQHSVQILYCYRETHPKAANTKDTGIFSERNHGFWRNTEAVLRYEQRITIDFLLQRLTQKPATQSPRSNNVLLYRYNIITTIAADLWLIHCTYLL